MLGSLRPSNWKCVSSNCAGLGLGLGAADLGTLTLRDPSGTNVTFTYASGGVGLSWGVKLPYTLAVSPSFLPGSGKIFLLDSFPKDELSQSDITGACVILDAGAALLAGPSGSMVYLGVDPTFLVGLVVPEVGLTEAAMSIVQHRVLPSANAVLFMGGFDVGIEADVGVDAVVGALYSLSFF